MERAELEISINEMTDVLEGGEDPTLSIDEINELNKIILEILQGCLDRINQLISPSEEK